VDIAKDRYGQYLMLSDCKGFEFILLFVHGASQH
jgi:hypothetical protein